MEEPNEESSNEDSGGVSDGAAEARNAPETDEGPPQGGASTDQVSKKSIGRKKSGIWAHYDASNDGAFAKCKLCDAKVSFNNCRQG